MQTIQRTCPECSVRFEAGTIGRPKIYCSMRCRRAVNYSLNTSLTCAVDSCDQARYQGRSMCSTHVMRKHRYGDLLTDRSRTGREWEHSHGYRVKTVADHPLADKYGATYSHRLVLFEKIGPGEHECHWCGCTLEWGVDLETDHLNNQRDDNSPENLVQTCHSCNTRRALARRYNNPWPPTCNSTKGAR